jgi:hypothetical protein
MKMQLPRLQKRHLLIAVAAALSMMVVVLYLRQPDISLSAFERIQTGMTEQEVSAILGRPPGESSRNGECSFETKEMWGDRRLFIPSKLWWGRDFAVVVFFDPEGKVVGARYEKIQRTGGGVISLFQRLVGIKTNK